MIRAEIHLIIQFKSFGILDLKNFGRTLLDLFENLGQLQIMYLYLVHSYDQTDLSIEVTLIVCCTHVSDILHDIVILYWHTCICNFRFCFQQFFPFLKFNLFYQSSIWSNFSSSRYGIYFLSPGSIFCISAIFMFTSSSVFMLCASFINFARGVTSSMERMLDT